MTISKSIKYFTDKATINKRRNRNVANKIQIYNNNVIDRYITTYNDGNPEKPSTAMLWADLSVLNKPEVYKNYNRIIQSPYTSNDNVNNMIIRNKAEKNLNSIVETELARINKNLDYVEQVLKQYEIPMQKYNQMLNEQHNKSLANRQQVLKDVAVQANELLVSEGLNINQNVFSYRNLEATAESLMRQSHMQSEFEEKQQINDEYIKEGKSAVYTKKKWVWTGEGKTTRHESNNMQERDFDELFIITNDETLDVDEIMHPSDPDGSPSNCYICYCECDYY